MFSLYLQADINYLSLLRGKQIISVKLFQTILKIVINIFSRCCYGSSLSFPTQLPSINERWGKGWRNIRHTDIVPAPRVVSCHPCRWWSCTRRFSCPLLQGCSQKAIASEGIHRCQSHHLQYRQLQPDQEWSKEYCRAGLQTCISL